MEFQVKFVSAAMSGPVEIPARRVGLAGLDQAREVTGVPGLDPALVKDHVGDKYYADIIFLSEDEARQANAANPAAFAEDSHVKVAVPRGSLSRYYRLQPVVKRDETDGRVLAVSWEWTADRDGIVADWIAAAAPLTWDPGEEDTEEPED